MLNWLFQKPNYPKTNMDIIEEQGLNRHLVVDVVGSFRHKMLVEQTDNGLYTVKLFEPGGYEMQTIAEDIVNEHMCILVNHALNKEKRLYRV